MNLLIILHIILSVSTITLIFIQPSSDSLESSNILSATNPTRRGWDKLVFTLTLVVLSVFLVSAIVQTII
jgi:protein translocase SecG subunit